MTGYVIKDMAMYFLFLAIVLKLAYAERDKHAFIFREDLVNMFQRATYSEGGMSFDAVS